MSLALYTAICWMTATTSATLDTAWLFGDLDGPLQAQAGEEQP